MRIKDGSRYPIEVLADLIWCGHLVDSDGYACIGLDEDFGPWACSCTNPYGMDAYFTIDKDLTGWRKLLSLLHKMRGGHIYGDHPPYY
jgi:hypothetical protein